MVASIGAVASPSQGVSYYERDGYYAKDAPEHREASAWTGKGAAELGLSGPVDPGAFQAVLEGHVPDGPRLGRPGKDGGIVHRPGRDLTLSAPKSVSLAALAGGAARVADAHGRAVARTLAWVEGRVIETRMKDPENGRMIRASGQKAVIAAFAHETSRNLDPQLHTHAVIANMVQGEDGKWRTMANEKLYRSKMLIGALYRSELAREVVKLGYSIEKTHADGRFEIQGISREVIEAFSTRRAEIEAAMAGRGLGTPADNQRMAQRAALMTRAAKREVDRAVLREGWETVHAFQGRTVDTVIAAMEANHPGLTTQKTLYVEISRARDRAELVTDDKAALRERLEAVTGERIAALEAVGPDKAKGRDAGLDADRSAGREGDAPASRERDRSPEPAMERNRAPKSMDRGMEM